MSLIDDYSWSNATKVIDQGVGWVSTLGNAWAGVEAAKREDRNYYVQAQEQVRNAFSDGSSAPHTPYDPAQTLGVRVVAPTLNTGNAGGPVTQSLKNQAEQTTIIKWAGLGLLGLLGFGLLLRGK